MEFRKDQPLTEFEINEVLRHPFFRLLQVAVPAPSSKPPIAISNIDRGLLKELVRLGHAAELRDAIADAAEFFEKALTEAEESLGAPRPPVPYARNPFVFGGQAPEQKREIC